ncbi:MAG: dTMP kinase [Nitrosopumilus sp. B06]|nr:MAG: dTMP kinase [Nitrosopumilus sp. D6]RNJ79488.1 MAG: dTMP kinase [Nitrosopumilus sp. B06]
MIIAIEGGDQAGKLTQSRMLARALKRCGHKTKLFHFPDYTTPVGREIKGYLDGRRKHAPQLIHCLLAANRWEKLHQIQKYQKNHTLVMNRYYHSNVVYGMANGLNQKWLENLDAGMPRTDLVILLDVTQGESFRRQRLRRDRFERDAVFSKKISATYKKLARKKRWKVIDASLAVQEIHEKILETSLGRL